MYFRFSKLARTIIIINIILNIGVGILHGYNIHRLNQSNEAVKSYMAEEKVTRKTAIIKLTKYRESLL